MVQELENNVLTTKEFQNELTKLLNRHSIDTLLDIPDFIIKDHLIAFMYTLGKFKEQLEEYNDTIAQGNI